MNLRRVPWRMPRAVAVAAAVLGLAAGAHILAGGELPAPPVMVALAAVVTLTAVLLAGAKMTAPVLAGYLLTGQYALHRAFCALSGTYVERSEPAHHAPGAAAIPFPGPDPAPHAHLAAHASAAMLGLHLLATLATAAVLARAEASLWALAAWLRQLTGLPTPGAMPPAFRPAAIRDGQRQRQGEVPGQVPARGPPLWTASHLGLPAPTSRLQNGRTLTMKLFKRQRIRLSLALAAGLLIPAAAAAPALAHDALESTSPAADATVTSAPQAVSLTLSEPPTDSKSLNLSVITVTDGEGKTLSDGTVTVAGATISTKLAPGANGPHKVLWRAVSSDGHPIEGSYTFTVQDPARAAATTPSSPATPAASATSGTVPVEAVKPPNNENALPVLGIAAAVIAILGGILYIARRRRTGSGESRS